MPLIICWQVREGPGKITINSLPYFNYREKCVVKRTSQATDNVFLSLLQIQETKMFHSPAAFAVTQDDLEMKSELYS